MRRLLLAGSLLAASLATASAQQLEDGMFICTLGSMMLGQIEIADGMYRGPAFDGKFEDSYPIEVTEAGTINWDGPLGGLSSGGNKVVSTVLKNAGGGTIGFDITIQNERGNFQTISCSPD